ncbi:PAS domain S-box-containing protein/diguanylate cyclase (GGDEF) domain-containing protein [Oceanobacillus limi]|uniref:PAS domain S-box-containing protein/diguanylate cyclase (GGDEF) domain-containing protein n=1 Tax=Oceanobacillus limi TaxID=930131 RepID=A0A1I0DA09_9BACI|nr:EAL domain-containing protein [Oceanobacillus limi]SET28502.1 PAS domain S-box-containing protein/diguanylate cyclase (GGDEF) domain-containing protein [Oceanobacillus limi]
MTNGKTVLPMHNRILSSLREAVLFVRDDGIIMKGNDVAANVLSIESFDKQSIYDYFNFDLLKKSREVHQLMELRNQDRELIEVNSIQVSENSYCLLLHTLSFQDKAEEIKQYINENTAVGSEGIVMYGDHTIVDCDTVFSNMFGYAPEEIKGMEIRHLIDQKSLHKMERLCLTSENTYELIGVHRNGSKFHVEVIDYPYNNQGTIVRVASVKDITERIENENRIEYMAYYDELTDLPNRNFFHKVLQEAVSEAKESGEILSVFFIDLDYFKEINDTLGYTFGDQLLKACGDRLKAFLHMDTFIARMSGDEFLILQRNTPTKEAAVDLAERLIAEFERPIKMGEYEIYTSVSIGISIYPENGTNANDLIKHADSAMYVIKEKHRNNYNLFDSSISENFKMRLTMETELRKALKQGQFELHYQPQKNLNTGKIVGLEALLRWNHPEKGYISPGEFIPLAEKTGLIMEIGDWVLYESCKQNKRWQDQGYEPVIVSVNLSAKQFHQRSLVQKVKDILADTGLDPQYLELEITESMAMAHEDFILNTLHELRKLGVLVSIDDFGTGYSSFKYLSLFPITKLKIDKMFLNDEQRENKAIVKSIIHMSHSLNMKVIAEGVETLEQLTFLSKARCDEMQGFYLSKPLPAPQLTKFFVE